MRRIYEDGYGLQRVLGHEFLYGVREAYREVLLLNMWPVRYPPKGEYYLTYEVMERAIESLTRMVMRCGTNIVSDAQAGAIKRAMQVALNFYWESLAEYQDAFAIDLDTDATAIGRCLCITLRYGKNIPNTMLWAFTRVGEVYAKCLRGYEFHMEVSVPDMAHTHSTPHHHLEYIKFKRA